MLKILRKLFTNKIRLLLNKLGINIVVNRVQRTTMDHSLMFLKNKFYPKTIFDVGVAYGTPELYETFNKSKFILVEPIEDFNMHLKKYLSQDNFEIENCCASDSEGFENLYVRDKMSTSSVHKGSSNVSIKKVKKTTLDNLANKFQVQSPVLIKIDSEGHEISVLKGSKKLLNITDVVIAEVTFNPVLKNACTYLEVINFLKNKDFKIFDIVNIRNENFRLSQADIVFVKSSFYSDFYNIKK